MSLWTSPRRFRALSWTLCIAVSVAACSSNRERVDPNEPLKGKRIPVLALEEQLRVDENLVDKEIRLPRPYANQGWPQVGGASNHAMHHLALGPDPQVIWRSSIGEGSTGNHRILAQPVVGDGKLFAIDSGWRVTALNQRSGERIWSTKLKDKDESLASAFGGGIGYSNGRVFVAMGSGFAAAVDADSGAQLWRTDFEVALRGSPAVDGSRVYVTTHDNQLHALDVDTGEILWSHVALSEQQALMGSSTPAVVGDTVVAAFASGELFAIKAENGRVVWMDSLTRTGRATALSTLNDIDGQPVVDRGQVFAVGHSGRMAAIDLRTGERLWENNIESNQTPWVIGDYIYVLTLGAEVVCLDRATGKVRWMVEMQRHKKNDRQKVRVVWSGPIVAGDRLLMISNGGYVVSLSPYTGDFLGAVKIPKQSAVSPIVVDETLYVLGDNGKIIAMR